MPSGSAYGSRTQIILRALAPQSPGANEPSESSARLISLARDTTLEHSSTHRYLVPRATVSINSHDNN